MRHLVFGDRRAAVGIGRSAPGRLLRTSGVAAVAGSLLLLAPVSPVSATVPVGPIASICNPNTVWDVSTPITLDASCSTFDSTHDVVIAWDYAYDGSGFVASVDLNNLPVEGITVVKTDGFSTSTQDIAGNPTGTTHSVCVQIADRTLSLTSLDCMDVQVGPASLPPIASLSMNAYLGTVNHPVQLDASASSDPNGDPITFAWELNNDQMFNDATGTTPTFTWRVPGTYGICVRVTDHPDQNVPPHAAASQSTVACSTVEIGVHSPVASAGGPYGVAIGSSTVLDASASFDPDGLPLTFAWDLNNDGSYTDSTSVTPDFSVPADTPAGKPYPVCVLASNGYRTATACANVNVLPAPHATPVAVVALSASVEAGTGVVPLDANASYDPDGGSLTFAWSTDGGGTFADATAATTTYTPAASTPVGSTVTLTLTVDNGFHTGTATGAVTVVDTTAPTLHLPAGVTAFATFATGAPVAFSAPTTTDAGDGSDPVLCDRASGAAFALGSNVVHCSSVDHAGNRAQGSFTVTVTFSWSGYLLPIKVDGSTVFKSDDPLRVRFALTGPSARITTLVARLRVARIVKGVVGLYTTAPSADRTTGGLFRYDPKTARYVFSLSTRALGAGTWSLLSDLGDGSPPRTVTITLKGG